MSCEVKFIMANYGIANTATSNLTNTVVDITVNPLNTDGATGQDEYTWQNTKWSQYWGYFNSIPELKSTLLMKATWDVGKGYECDAETKVILDHVSGWGKDTFTDILFNMDLISRLSGDAFAEIITDDKTKTLLNLKVLDPGSIKIVVDKKGIIKRYEQTNKISGKAIEFKPEEIFHISHNRLADQIHGISDIDAIEQTILAENENFVDLKKIMHRQARPMIVFKLGTDDATKIAAFQVKMDAAVNKGENIYVPDDTNTFSYEVVKIDLSPMIMSWREDIRNKFYRTFGLPLTIFGNGGSTESGGKIEYLAHEQVFSHDQRFLEDQVWNQLFLKITLNSPVTLLENLQNDQKKDGNQGLEMQKSDVTAGSGA
jgi:hypothetical protein